MAGKLPPETEEMTSTSSSKESLRLLRMIVVSRSASITP